MALAWDRYRLGERRWLRAKPLHIRVAGRILATNAINLGVAIAFAVMGGSVLWLASSAQMTGGPGFQVVIGKGLETVFTRVESWVDPVPELILGAAVLGLAAVLVVATLRDRGLTPEADDADSSDGACHGTAPTPFTAPRASHQH